MTGRTPPQAPETSGTTGLIHGQRDYQRAVLAMLAAGLAAFNALYTTQAMLPTFVTEFGISPSMSALTISATTGMLGVCVVPASILSERLGRGPVLITSALVGTALGLFLPLVSDPALLIALRALQGAALAGVPAVAMTWLSEELHPDHLGRAMGIYVAGNTVGGLTGRLIPAGILEFASWKWAILASCSVAVVMAIGLTVLLPKQRRFQPKSINPKHEFHAMTGHWRDIRLAGLFLIAFVGMGVFVSLYNYMGFRMIHAFGLSEALVGAVFLMYLAGTWSSARSGALAKRFGRGQVLLLGPTSMLISLGLMATPWLPTTLIGLFVFTAGFFAMHSTASAFIGIIATHDRAEASSMYLCCYYMGSSVLGWLTGLIFGHFGWYGLLAALLVGTLILGGIALTIYASTKSAKSGTPGAPR